MSETIYFVGDPGPGRVNMLNIIRQFGIEPHRIDVNEAVPFQEEGEEALAIVIGLDVEDRASYVTALRERRDLAGIPLLARTADGSDEEVESAILDGVDDVLVDGAEWHFGAFLVHLGKSEDWSVLRAPQGLAVLGEEDRATRIRIASNLRKNGYDVIFAGGPSELVMNIPVSLPRIIVCSASMAEQAVAVVESGQIVLRGEGIPWVIFGEDGEAHGIGPVAGVISKVGTIRDIGNTEQLTFVINEVVAPEQPEVRLTPRLLYGTTVRFGAENMLQNLRGYTYNVNNGGAFVRTLVPLPKGARVSMKFKVPFSDVEVEGIGQVVWVREFADADGPMSPPGMGLQFVDWNEGDRDIYEAAYALLREEQEGERQTRVAPSIFSAIMTEGGLDCIVEELLPTAPEEEPAPTVMNIIA